MIPSDHFVRFYNEVFKALDAKGRRCLVAYWRELGRLQKRELAARFRKGGVTAARDYWKRIIFEENCDAEVIERPDGFEFHMRACPSLGKVLDNDATPFELYCDHCMGWVGPVMKATGLYAVMDMVSRREPRCVFFVTADKAAAARAARRARLSSTPYRPATLPPRRKPAPRKSRARRHPGGRP
jgi:hypothetical protein